MNILLAIIKTILGMKFGVLLLIVLGGIIGISILRNILTGSFSLAKFAGGFNLFSGGVQGKLIYYGVILILAFGLYHQLTRATWNYDTDYKNTIRDNRDVYLDQRVGDTCSEKCIIAMQPFGFTLLKVGCVKSCTASITQQTKTDEAKVTTFYPNTEASKPAEVKKTSIFKKVTNIIKLPFTLIKKVVGK